jgi:hypothetical protein
LKYALLRVACLSAAAAACGSSRHSCWARHCGAPPPRSYGPTPAAAAAVVRVARVPNVAAREIASPSAWRSRRRRNRSRCDPREALGVCASACRPLTSHVGNWQPANVELIDHCAEYVAKHGASFEAILKTRNFGQPVCPARLSLGLPTLSTSSTCRSPLADGRTPTGLGLLVLNGLEGGERSVL